MTDWLTHSITQNKWWVLSFLPRSNPRYGFQLFQGGVDCDQYLKDTWRIPTDEEDHGAFRRLADVWKNLLLCSLLSMNWYTCRFFFLSDIPCQQYACKQSWNKYLEPLNLEPWQRAVLQTMGKSYSIKATLICMSINIAMCKIEWGIQAPGNRRSTQLSFTLWPPVVDL